MITAIAHNAMKVTDMQQSLDFYCRTLGLQQAFEIPDDAGNPWIVYLKICDGAFIELFYDGVKELDPAYDSSRIGYHHFCLTVGDIRPLAEQLCRQGIIPSADLSPGRDRNTGVWIHDPDGNAVEIVQYDPASPQMLSNKAAYAPENKGYTGIGHHAFVTDNMDEALEFYCSKLGFERIYDMPDEAGNPWLVYLRVKDGTYIELFYGGKEQADVSPSAAGFMHMCLECDDVYKTVEELRSKGVAIDVEPSQGKDKNIQAWIHDPNGNKIELMTIDPESPQANA